MNKLIDNIRCRQDNIKPICLYFSSCVRLITIHFARYISWL